MLSIHAAVMDGYIISKDAIQKVKDEKDKQIAKWGLQTHNLPTWNTILNEEVGEVSKAILEGKTEELKEELIQVAAVALNIYESIKNR